ncbi:GRP family sugar transporter [Lactobacillus sp. ESL0684]|uniref:ribose/proton symporter RbsU n=1 Tax=unclassified Lactobacillus TaxID=2620435 RepID=UPI0023F6D821|nr:MULTISPECIES: GRP family sugar transporter [unclassified Lactobacillus]WEV41223.1 GRP family sugar transporter [Lactobacillus sp. ESL0681]WEV44492.1 GRP family sugar transporter [Lactobacillus sp. ESL0684]
MATLNTTALLVGLGPLIGWGLFPTIASKIGGKPANQILGTTLGTFIFGLAFALIGGYSLPTGSSLFLSIISGIGWASAQIVTFMSFNLVGSSRVMPITTAFQLLGASLWGVIALGNWPGVKAKIIGGLALVAIIIGAYMTVWSENKTAQKTNLLKKAVIWLLFGEIGYWLYSAAPQAARVDGQHAFLPQAIGMLLTGIGYGIYVSLKNPKQNPFKELVSYQQIFAGFFFAFAALTYLISAQPNMNGLATGFVLSQTSVILATLTGIWFLGQKKTKKELIITIIGLVIILIAAAVTEFI